MTGGIPRHLPTQLFNEHHSKPDTVLGAGATGSHKVDSLLAVVELTSNGGTPQQMACNQCLVTTFLKGVTETQFPQCGAYPPKVHSPMAVSSQTCEPSAQSILEHVPQNRTPGEKSSSKDS